MGYIHNERVEQIGMPYPQNASLTYIEMYFSSLFLRTSAAIRFIRIDSHRRSRKDLIVWKS